MYVFFTFFKFKIKHKQYDKRLVLLDRRRTMAYGHHGIEPELHKVFLWMVQNFKLKFGSEMKKWRMDMFFVIGIFDPLKITLYAMVIMMHYGIPYETRPAPNMTPHLIKNIL